MSKNVNFDWISSKSSVVIDCVSIVFLQGRHLIVCHTKYGIFPIFTEMIHFDLYTICLQEADESYESSVQKDRTKFVVL